MAIENYLKHLKTSIEFHLKSCRAIVENCKKHFPEISSGRVKAIFLKRAELQLAMASFYLAKLEAE